MLLLIVISSTTESSGVALSLLLKTSSLSALVWIWIRQIQCAQTKHSWHLQVSSCISRSTQSNQLQMEWQNELRSAGKHWINPCLSWHLCSIHLKVFHALVTKQLLVHSLCIQFYWRLVYFHSHVQYIHRWQPVLLCIDLLACSFLTSQGTSFWKWGTWAWSNADAERERSFWSILQLPQLERGFWGLGKEQGKLSTRACQSFILYL